MSFLSFVVQALDAVDLDDDINRIVIDRIVTRCRNRPHPWSTKADYISWSGLTDRSYNARLLPAKPAPIAEAIGTARPPIADVAALFGVPDGGVQRVCPKSTGLFPAFAQYLTDGFIRTQISNDPLFTDRKRTTSNHEIDLSPLYGRTPAQTAVLRLKSEAAGSRGQLKTQIIAGEIYSPYLFDGDAVRAEFRDAAGTPVLDPPLGLDNVTPAGKATLFAVGGDRVNAAPQVAMMNTLFLREHNRLAALLEGEHPDWDDERVFETARNILIVMFIKIVVEDYINHINTTEFPLQADPSGAWRAQWNRPNWMTVEFSLLYRWHSLVAEHVEWGGVAFSGRDLLLDNSRLTECGLATSFVQVSANNAASLGLENSATFLARAEFDAIAQARLNNLASYNDYRIAMGMARRSSFKAMVGAGDDNPAEDARRNRLAGRLEALYGDIDNVEFYVGLFAEPREPNGPLPELIIAMVAMDAFSQALTNPLLSEHVWGNDANKLLAFTATGIGEIEATATLRDVLVRNAAGLADRFVGMTRQDWARA